jgi:hypothetical protein
MWKDKGRIGRNRLAVIRALFGVPAMLTSALVIAATCPVGAVDNKVGAVDNKDTEQFGDIFAHPRDRSYLPGTAPSRAEFDSSIAYTDERGDVTRWEYRKNKKIITRELWVDDSGETKGRLGIGRKF